MDLNWLFQSRREQIISEQFPEDWLTFIVKHIKHWSALKPAEQTRLQDDLRIFMAEKNWEGAIGFTITDQVKVTVSALASLLTVGFPKHDYFPNVKTIIVYPTSYVAPSQTYDGNVLDNATEARLGEAHGNGPIILSWSDIETEGDGSSSGHSLVQHEFAHKLDFRDGDANGVPLLRDKAEVDDWAAVMSAEYDLLVDDVKHHHHTVLRPYGATNPAEFFAVCTECYYEKPKQLRTHKPELYRVLADYYGIDWAERMDALEL